MELILVRGLPGSGKTYYATKYYFDYTHFEADLYRYDYNGKYVFELSLCYLCHKLCLKSTELALKRGENVIVANTFVTIKELKPYIKLAEELGTILKIHTCWGNYKSEHNVPEEKIEQMRGKWQDYDY